MRAGALGLCLASDSSRAALDITGVSHSGVSHSQPVHPGMGRPASPPTLSGRFSAASAVWPLFATVALRFYEQRPGEADDRLECRCLGVS